ncbi:HAMP domain-containing sensor histidine kinase [Caldilinea sp.]|uniref:sensor histidine kinase n=1 Tax=Caldilinea sp. TaxID=2293560 RepID=UPI001B092531|nr:HAMP domain-containing sensor histidine kinase [Caldilinea sp.]MBO9394908.1 HAMP domain-containing histidine kinase [Caldilinea sp.]
MIIYPVRRSLTPFMWFVVLLIGLYGATLFVFWWLVRPTLFDLRLLAIVLGGAAGLIGAGGFLAHRLGWLQRIPHAGGAMFAGFLLAALLPLPFVWGATQLLFIEAYDALVAMTLMFFAAGVVVALGFLQTALFVEKLDALTGAVEHLRMGRYHVRAEIDDGSELARYADALAALAARLEATDRKERQLERMRRNLIAWIGYDLRVPLVAARAGLENVVEGPAVDPETSRRYLQMAWRNLNALSDLIDDLYDMAQLDIGGIHLERTEASICALVETTIAELSPIAAQKGVTLTHRCDPDTPPLLIDARQIGRVLNNLVSDAIQRTPKGGSVKLNIHPSRHNVLIEITDMANRNSSEDLRTLFKLLFSEDDARSLSKETPRLRLAMADAIVRAHGSQIHPQRLGDQGLRLVFALARADVVNPLIRGM